jgi:peptide/nickel transport system substrate-binding protein
MHPRITTASRSKRRPALLATAAIAASLLVLSGCSVSAEDDAPAKQDLTKLKDETFTAKDPSKAPAASLKRTDSFVSTINKPGGVFLPGFYDNGWDGNAVAPIFASLDVTDSAGKPKGDLAEKWDISDDGLTYTYHLRKGLKFSDGSPLTAKDVAFTLTLLNDPAYSGGVDFSDIVIKGADAYKKGKADAISGIKVKDDQTISITTEKKNPLALTTLGGQVIPESYYGKDYKRGKLDYLRKLYSKPIGAGPYQLKKYTEGQEIDYTANPNYYGGKPSIDKLIFKVVSADSTLQNFQNGDIDHGGFGSDPEVLKKLKGLGYASIRTSVVPDIGEIWTNNKKPGLKQTVVRKALNYGLDRQQIIDAKYKGLGQVADVYAAPTQWSYTTKGVTKYGFDPDKANKLLDEAGWKKGSNGIRAKNGKQLKVSYITTKSDDPVIPIAKQNYPKIGVKFVPEVLDANTAFDRFLGGDYDLASFRTDGLSDPDDAVSEFASTDPKINVSGYHNAKVTKLVKQAKSTFDESERKKIYADLYRELSQDPPGILLDYRKSISAWNARVQGADKFVTGDGDSSLYLAKLKIKDQ